MNVNNRRRDVTTSQLIEEALRFQRAFDQYTATQFLQKQGFGASFAHQVLAGLYDRRQRPAQVS